MFDIPSISKSALMLPWKIGLYEEQKRFCSITYGFSIAYYHHRIRKTLRKERKRQKAKNDYNYCFCQ